MTKTIVQKIGFRNNTPETLYNLYMNAENHAMIADAPATISEKAGSRYSVHGGYITGKNLHLVKNKLIVQTWRGADWSKEDMDSTFIINLESKGKNVILHAVHANVPDEHAESIEKGWYAHYWNPWKQFLAGKPIKRPQM